MCHKEQSKELTRGVNRVPYKPFTTHLPCELFETIHRGSSSSGGQGEVNLRTNTNPNTRVALKRPNQSTGFDQYFESEFRHLQTLSHSEYIVRCYGHTRIDSDHFLVMEAAPYGDLLNVMKGVTPILQTKHGLGLLLRWMFDVANGLSKAYCERMHRSTGRANERSHL